MKDDLPTVREYVLMLVLIGLVFGLGIGILVVKLITHEL
jgi:NhaP-type Na+/H+ or K+/H+ antiporter